MLFECNYIILSQIQLSFSKCTYSKLDQCLACIGWSMVDDVIALLSFFNEARQLMEQNLRMSGYNFVNYIRGIIEGCFKTIEILLRICLVLKVKSESFCCEHAV